MLSIWQWLIQRSDAGVWAPLVLRDRQGPGAVSVFHTNGSWDSTLASTGQFTLTNALGAPVYRADGWTLDTTIPDVPDNWGELYSEPVRDNVMVNDSVVTAATIHWSESGHVYTTRPVTYLAFEKVYPPVVPLDPVQAFKTPICAHHATVVRYFGGFLAGEGQGEIVMPEGDCESLYGAAE
tara:strand:- start:126 stop:668 length:543 start_codon:yes stop_codon:yes gene_type:complete